MNEAGRAAHAPVTVPRERALLVCGVKADLQALPVSASARAASRSADGVGEGAGRPSGLGGHGTGQKWPKRLFVCFMFFFLFCFLFKFPNSNWVLKFKFKSNAQLKDPAWCKNIFLFIYLFLI